MMINKSCQHIFFYINKTCTDNFIILKNLRQQLKFLSWNRWIFFSVVPEVKYKKKTKYCMFLNITIQQEAPKQQK